MHARTSRVWLVVAAAPCLVLLAPARGGAVTQVTGNTYVEDAAASRPGATSNLLQTGANVVVVPQTKKSVKAALTMRLNYIRSDADEIAAADLSPFGNLGFDLAGETFNLNLQHTQTAAVGTAAELTRQVLTHGSMSLRPRDLPSLSLSVSRGESTAGAGPTATVDTATAGTEYRYRWAGVRAGVSADRRQFAGRENQSRSFFVGGDGRYEILPMTFLDGDVGLSRFDAAAVGGGESSTDTRSLRLTANSRPLRWLELGGNLSRADTEFRSDTADVPGTSQQSLEASAGVIPHPSVKLGATVGNRRFDDVATVRSVDFRTLTAAFTRELRDRILFGAGAGRTWESDPDQGENVTDSLNVNASADVTSRVSLRVNTGMSRSENRTFVSARTFNASGTLADRDRLDRDSGGLAAGFIFLDVVNDDLYTKNSVAIGDWSLPTHFDPVVARFAVVRTVQLTAAPTDRTTVLLGYTSSASAPGTEALGKLGTQSANGSLSYLATRRSSFGLSGTASFPERLPRAYAATGSYAYRFVRNHQLNLAYGRQFSAIRETDTLTAALTLSLPKQTAMDFAYSTTQLFREDQTHFFRIRASHSF